MKINHKANFSFKGHSAGKIKALYMQNAYLPAQIPIYNELRAIGKRHNFDVYIHNQDMLHSENLNKPSDKACQYELWAQDNKTILKKEGQTVIISGLYLPETEEIAAESLAKIKEIPHEKIELFLEAGNFFVGKKPDGKRYLIIGYSNIKLSALHYYLQSKIDNLSPKDVENFLKNQKIKTANGKTLATSDEFNSQIEKWGTIVLDKLQETFDVEREDITFISQGEYHNDLVIRPLNYPYILVNDEEMSLENIEKLKKKFKFDLNKLGFSIEMKNRLKQRNKQYASCDEICTQLARKGFVPIRIGGGYGLHTINFINSIVHQNGNDLIYITNSTEHSNKYLEYLQTLFEEDLKAKCPQIQNIYFVKGANIKNHSNIILEYLKKFKGGIHCLCAEEMYE